MRTCALIYCTSYSCTFLNFLAHVLVEFYELYSISLWKQGQNGLPNAPSICISFVIEFSYVIKFVVVVVVVVKMTLN